MYIVSNIVKKKIKSRFSLRNRIDSKTSTLSYGGKTSCFGVKNHNLKS